MADFEVHILSDLQALSRRAADVFAREVLQASSARGRFAVALSGGSTPRRLYEMLAAEPFRSHIPWSKVCVFWGDERCVPPDHPDSNYAMAYAALLSKVPLPAENIHRFRTELGDPQRVASNYEQVLREFFGTLGEGYPRYDLILLGLGADGHIASLFPGSPALQEQRRWVVAPFVEQLGAYRLTLTLPLLNEAHHLICVVSGEEKALALREVLKGEYRPEERPAQLLRAARGRVLWLADQAAASLLERPG